MNVPKLRFKEFDGEWEENSLAKLATFSKGKGISKDNLSTDGKPCILYGELYTKYKEVASTIYSRTNIKSSDLIKSEKLDVLIPSSGETAKDIACSTCIIQEDVLIGGDLNILRFGKEIDGRFISYQINGIKKLELSKYAQGATVVHLYSQGIKKLRLNIPTIEEQKKISELLLLLNKKIQLQQQKIDLLQEQKKGYMQKIFNRELRFKDEKGNIYPEWKEGILEDVLFLKLREVPKPKTSYIRLGLRSHAKGTFHQLVTNPEEVSMDKLYVVKKGDLVINITFAWEQALAIAESNDEDKLVSHRFPTYSFKENQYNQFYKYYLTTKYFKYALGNASPGGAGRNRVLNKKDFLKIKLSYPCFKEQSIIADFLDKLDCKVFTELKKLELLQKQKQGFMQQMFI